MNDDGFPGAGKKSYVSSCEIPAEGGPVEVRRSEGSFVLRFRSDFSWQGVGPVAYKRSADLPFAGVDRHELLGDRGEVSAFHLRYFEVAPGGYTSLEEHHHTHVIVALRGEGLVRMAERELTVRPYDVVYVAPRTPHQFRNPSGVAFGFLCIVDSVRDAPRAVLP